MKKRIYRAKNVKAVDWSELARQIGEQRVTIGIDIAKYEQFAALMIGDEAREPALIIKWERPTQTVETVSYLAKLGVNSNAPVQAVMEPTGTYGDALQALLEARGVEVFMVSPKRLHDAAEVFDGVPSLHDAKAAWLLTKLHREQVSRRWRPASIEQRQLRAMVELETLYEKQMLDNLNRLEASLARYWPEATSVSELDSATLLGVLAQIGSPQQVAADPQRVYEVVRSVARSYWASVKTEPLVEAARSTIGVPMVDAERQAMQELALEIQRNRDNARRVHQKVEELVGKVEEAAMMAPVVGTTTAAVVVTKLGLAKNYESASAFEKAAGLNLKERSSGRHKGRLKLTKRGSGTVRRYLFMAVLRLIQRGKGVVEFRRWYERKVARERGKRKLLAIGALMRKLVRALWHVGRGEQFDPGKLFDRARLGLTA